jgi:eukaryotic-like serine/threonine-protein kinase
MPDQPTGLPPRLGKYEIRREVGRGGMGVVYEGYDTVIHRRVALKTLVNELFKGTEAEAYLGRLKREAQAAGRLNHPNIVAVYDFGEEPLSDATQGGPRMAFIAMEFVEGRELSSFLSGNERFPPAAVVRIMSQLLDALDYSHRNGVVHRDIKPGNIIVLADGSVKVADFGIARIESSTLTQAGTVMGSPSYMSPEQFLGQTVDGRSDLYSAGVVLYELLTGEVPFAGSFSNVMHKVLNEQPSPPSVLNVNVPKAADALLTRALAKRPAERFQTAAEFKQALLAQLAPSENATAAPGALPAPASGAAANQATTLRQAATGLSRRTAVVIAACVLAVGIGSLLMVLHSRPPATRLTRAEPAAAVTASVGAPALVAATPPEPPAKSGTAVITAVGLADPQDPRFARQPAPIESQVWGDARRQLIEKAAAVFVDPKSIEANYALLRDKLFSHSNDYIATVLEQTPPQLSHYGLMLGTIRATVKVHDVQRSLNEISREDRVAFIRNNGNPTIAVDIRVAEDDPSVPPQRSAVAENILMERIRSFGFVAVDEPRATPPPDFLLNGEVKLKRLSATLPASGLTIVKFALTSWTIRAVDDKTGEEVYLNTKIPEKKSWASQELALQEVGQLIGSEFSRDFFLQYFDFGTKRVRLHLKGLPAAAGASVLAEANAAVKILNATLAGSTAGETVIDIDVAGSSDSTQDLVEGALVNPLNRKLGKSCFSFAGGDSAELTVAYDASCANDAMLARLDRYPPEALMDAPKSRIEDIVSDPARLQRTTL